MSIPAGYQLQVTSWENDGDNYKTEILSGLSKEEVDFYLTILEAVRESGFENEFSEECEDYERAAKTVFDSVMEKYEGKTIPEKFHDYLEDEDLPTEDLLGNSECYIFRVYSSHKVFYIPEPIMEVSSDFKDITLKRR